MGKNRIFHVISNTHWDREWRFTFQKNRQMLVEMIDRLLEILETEEAYRTFHLDSQTIVLEDYLQARPQKEAQLRNLIKEKRILVGPWFILPEEFQVGGESLVRNLLLGHQIAEKFGHVMKVGYSPFSWGQISQLPQIYKEFGIDVIMFYRGVNSLDSEKAEFIWEGADGTKTLTSRFSTMPRYNFYFYIYRPVIHNEQIPDVGYKWARGGLPFHFADKNLKDEDYNLLSPNDYYFSENLKPAVESIIQDQADDFTTPHIFWAEGHDSSGPNIKTVRIIKEADTLLPDDRVIHSNLEDYAKALKGSVDYEKLSLVEGERRSSQFDRRSGNLYGYTTSARMYLKQMNFETEKWLQFYAEPFNAIASLCGLDSDDRYPDIAWHLLLQNSAHDSIGGCSLDEIHEDMVNRYKQSQEISKGLFGRAAKHLAKHIDLKQYPEDSIHLVAINPLTTACSNIIEAFIDIPAEQDMGSITIKSLQGDAVPFQQISSASAEPVLEQMIDRPQYFSMQRYHGFIKLSDVPAMGIKTMRVLPSEQHEAQGADSGRIEKQLPVIENEFLKVSANKNGTVSIFDKETGQLFQNLAYFYDEGEAGHAWVHEPVQPCYDTLDSEPNIELILNGALITVCRISHHLYLPGTLEERSTGKRSQIVPIELKVILRKHARRVEFEVNLENTVKCHRLRMMFAYPFKADYSWGEGQFDVVKRSTDRPDTGDWIEQPMYDYPLHHFVDLNDGKNGAAIIVDGLKEYEVLEDKRTVALTLLRAFNYVIQPSSKQDYSWQPGAQCPGKHHYRLAFYPHAGNWQEGNVYPQALRFNNPLSLFQIGRAEGEIPGETSFLSVEPENLIFSALKKSVTESDNSLILRLYNPTESKIDGSIRFYHHLRAAEQVSMEEKTLKNLQIEKNHLINIEIAAKKIITLRLIFAEG